MYTLHYTIQNDQCDYTGRLRDENIFENIPCVVAYVNRRHNLSSSHVGHDDHWGEPDPLIDFSVEEILDIPTMGEVQSEPNKKGN